MQPPKETSAVCRCPIVMGTAAPIKGRLLMQPHPLSVSRLKPVSKAVCLRKRLKYGPAAQCLKWQSVSLVLSYAESWQFKQNSTLSLCGGLQRSWLENRGCPSQRLALSHCLLGARRHPASEGWTWEEKTASINSD